MTTTSRVDRQVRVASAEAAFALAATLAVCIRVEWAHGPDAVVMAVLVPVAMAFSVHGVFNASGLGRLNYLYVPLRLVALIAGLAYSYSHYHAMLPASLAAFGYDIRPLVALVVESLTVSALIAHHGHSIRSNAITGADAELAPAAAETDRSPSQTTLTGPVASGGLEREARATRKEPVPDSPTPTTQPLPTAGVFGGVSDRVVPVRVRRSSRLLPAEP